MGKQNQEGTEILLRKLIVGESGFHIKRENTLYYSNKKNYTTISATANVAS